MAPEEGEGARDALVAWAQTYAPELVEREEVLSVPVKAAAAHAERTGEVPDGMELREDVDVFYVRARGVGDD